MSERNTPIEFQPDQTVRQRLLVQATELFARKGYASTTVREIVQAAGVTKPVLYYYFRNKEGIYLELMKEAWERFDSILVGAQKGPGTVRKKILNLMDQVFELVLERIEVARIGYSMYYGYPQGAPPFDFDAFHLMFHEVVKGLVEEGISTQEFQAGNVVDMTWAIIGAVNLAIELQICHPEMGVGKEGVARMINLIFEGIAAKESKKKGE
ncbi:MAG: TetR/AcrR family transcriptional regulator [Desulfobacca sp.]|nr:TetR/AcrR family transcriptional regulator [Desulfobacca sp.]